MKTLPYNVRIYDGEDGKRYQPYLPKHPYIGCPVYRSRREAVAYIANSAGLSYDEYRKLSREGRCQLCPKKP